MSVININKPYYVKYSNSESSVSYPDGNVMGNAVLISAEIEMSDDTGLCADSFIAETGRNLSGGTLEIIVDAFEMADSKTILGLRDEPMPEIHRKMDTAVSELNYGGYNQMAYIGVGIIIKNVSGGTVRWQAIIFTKVIFTIPSDFSAQSGCCVPQISGTIMNCDLGRDTRDKEKTFATEAQAEAYIRAKLNATEAA